MALASAGKASPDQDFWDIEYLQLSELLVKTHKAANGVRDDDIVLASDADEVGHAEAVRILRHCEVEPNRFRVSLSSIISHRFNFNWLVFTGAGARDVMNRKTSVRKEQPRTTLEHTAEHFTTFGDVIMAVIKDLHISEARAKVPAGNVRILSHPFDVEPDTLGQGVRLWQNIDVTPNDRTQDVGWVGPVMHRTEFAHRFGEEALPRIPWVARWNPHRYPLLMPNDKPFKRIYK